MKTLGDASVNNARTNNVTAIRLLAAVLVIFSHAWPQTAAGANPINGLLPGGLDLGATCVAVFFSLSGYLLALSAERLTPAVFVFRRILRIYPALWAGTAVFVICGAFSTGRYFEYLADPQTQNFIRVGSTMAVANSAEFAASSWLPGVFTDTHIGFVNGSLWTLPAEIQAYLAMALCMTLARVLSVRSLPVFWIAALTICVFYFSAIPFAGSEPRYRILLISFFAGAVFFSLKSVVPMTGWLVGTMLIGVAAVNLLLPSYTLTAVTIFIPYASLYLAFGIAPIFSGLDRIGDFSYGVYIYGWPAANIVVALDPTDNPWLAAGGGLTIALGMATASWFLIERPAMTLKNTEIIMAKARKLFPGPLRSPQA
ncbi:acyltransferase [Mesorhizobium sp. B2-3-4]|uniref:acyltransferase family protein n=1 Tax=Mesorhizobium sp. B2-3-4 TaxID=2589959 RepID=UPI00112C44D5|nr:acyltransferase [Mesorhizobium sp. B2-3-4]TPM39571.1 acyltransferase [Mesorhizobium sp. B2-3-4]